MDAAYASAFAALSGSTVGALASFLTTTVTLAKRACGEIDRFDP
jgi:hypothetical protein